MERYEGLDFEIIEFEIGDVITGSCNSVDPEVYDPKGPEIGF